jgi:2-polyprenyl-6-methoxyphenol hydroxylase-like FAD-dependent oxidoreductase
MTRNGRALVVGASMGGLLAARVLADRFDEVVVVERDTLPETKQARRGVPQGRHTHLLLGRGREVLEQHFPGFTREVVERGALVGDLTERGRVFIRGGFLASYHSGLDCVCASRPLLELVVRERVLALDNVHVLDGTDAVGLRAPAGSVTGLRTRGRGGLDEQVLDADLVVGATGRGAGSVSWATELGYPAPAQEEIRVDITYVSRTYRRRPGDLGDGLFLAVPPEPPGVRAGAVLAQEDDRWIVTLIGYLGERPPEDADCFRRYAASLPTPGVADLLQDAEPVGEAAVAHFPASRRRRFERLSLFPEGYLVVADGISSFNPVYGQGMSVAAEESVILGQALDEGLAGLPGRFYAAAAKVVDMPWTIAASSDLRFPQVPGERSVAVRLFNAYLARLLTGARRDPVLAQAFTLTNNLMAGPQSLLRPEIAARVLVGGSRR